MRKYTVKENVISALIGCAIMGAMTPFIISARAEVEPIIVNVRHEPVLVETFTTVDITEDKLLIEPLNIGEDVERPMLVPVTEETDENEESEEIKEPYFNYTEEDVYLVGNMTFHEENILFCKVSEEKAIRATRLAASCLVNRAKMNYFGFGRTIQSQIKPSQYASFSKITATKQKDVPDIFYEIAEDIMKNGPEVSERLVFQSEFKQGDSNGIEPIYNQHFGLISEKEYRYWNSK